MILLLPQAFIFAGQAFFLSFLRLKEVKRGLSLVNYIPKY